jgi:hypothetical protein
MMIPAKQPPGIPCQDQVNIVAVAGPVEVVDSFQAGGRAVVHPVGVRAGEIDQPVPEQHICAASDGVGVLLEDAVHINLNRDAGGAQSFHGLFVYKVTSLGMRKDGVVTGLQDPVDAVTSILLTFIREKLQEHIAGLV